MISLIAVLNLRFESCVRLNADLVSASRSFQSARSSGLEVKNASTRKTISRWPQNVALIWDARAAEGVAKNSRGSSRFRQILQFNLHRKRKAREDLSRAGTRGLVLRRRYSESRHKARRSAGSFLPAFFHDLLHLLHVVHVVAGKHAHDLANGFFASLLMHPVVFPQWLRNGFQHGQVVLT